MSSFKNSIQSTFSGSGLPFADRLQRLISGTVQEGSADAIEAVKKSITDTLHNVKPGEIVSSVVGKLTDIDAWVDFLPEPRSVEGAKAVLAANSRDPNAQQRQAEASGQKQPPLGRYKFTAAYVVLIVFEVMDNHPDIIHMLCAGVLIWSLACTLVFGILTGWDTKW